jgi:hypothetical protein
MILFSSISFANVIPNCFPISSSMAEVKSYLSLLGYGYGPGLGFSSNCRIYNHQAVVGQWGLFNPNANHHSFIISKEEIENIMFPCRQPYLLTEQVFRGNLHQFGFLTSVAVINLQAARACPTDTWKIEVPSIIRLGLDHPPQPPCSLFY